MLEDANEGMGIKQNHTIYIDTNLPTYGIDQAVTDIRKLISKNIEYKIVLLIPEMKKADLIPGIPLTHSFLL